MTTPTTRARAGSTLTPRAALTRRAVLTRRDALTRLLAAAGGVALTACRTDTSHAASEARTSTAPVAAGGARLLPGAVSDRVLVVIELDGGNDGLSTLVPAADSRYHDLRGDLAHDPGTVIAVDDEVGLHPALARTAERGLVTVEGVGAATPDLSHFEMAGRWRQGDVDGASRFDHGFLGRLADGLASTSPLAAVSVAGAAPDLDGEMAVGAHLQGIDDLWFLSQPDWLQASAYREVLAGYGDASIEQVISLADRLAAVATDENDDDATRQMRQDGGDLGRQLVTAADLLDADLGTRIVRARLSGFDTHEGHRWRHDSLMAQIDAALDGFRRRLDAAGLADRVLIATISEFGRRVEPNDSGLDHGTASTMFVAGPGEWGEVRRLGESPSLAQLDADGNLRATVSFDRYLGALAEGWMGVDAASVLPSLAASGERPIDLAG